MRTTAIVSILVGLALVAGRPGVSWADEKHPEHPEHPEHPDSDAEVTIERLATAIEAWVAWDSKLHGGYVLVWDGEQKRTLELKLDKVHRERLSALGNGIYFACADFKAQDGSVYETMARDTYALGWYLAHHKYRYLRLSYIFFLAGFILACVVQVIALLAR